MIHDAGCTYVQLAQRRRDGSKNLRKIFVNVTVDIKRSDSSVSNRGEKQCLIPTRRRFRAASPWLMHFPLLTKGRENYSADH